MECMMLGPMRLAKLTEKDGMLDELMSDEASLSVEVGDADDDELRY